MSDTPTPTRPKRPTMTDVARLAEVSQMTVSRVMREEGYVSREIAERVRDAARRLGYVHNRIAGALAAESNTLVGVVLPTLQNRVFTEVLSGITDALAQSRFQPVFGVSEYDPDAEAQLVQDLLSWRPKGLILTGLEHRPETREAVRAAGVRVAEVMDLDGDPIQACFGFSNREAGAGMARHLLAKGYRRFGYVGSRLELDLRARKRRDGFLAALRDGGGALVAELDGDEPSSMQVGRAMTARMLAGAGEPEAIYYSNDDMAAGGLMHCLANGIRVPDEVALASFNGLAFLEALPQRITTTRSPRFEIGRLAAEYVCFDPDEVAPVRRVDLGCRILPGDTS